VNLSSCDAALRCACRESIGALEPVSERRFMAASLDRGHGILERRSPENTNPCAWISRSKKAGSAVLLPAEKWLTSLTRNSRNSRSYLPNVWPVFGIGLGAFAGPRRIPHLSKALPREKIRRSSGIDFLRWRRSRNHEISISQPRPIPILHGLAFAISPFSRRPLPSRGLTGKRNLSSFPLPR